jgi:hypothetical protein
LRLLTLLGHRLLCGPKQEKICQTDLDDLLLVTWLHTLEDFLFPILKLVLVAVGLQERSYNVRVRTTMWLGTSYFLNLAAIPKYRGGVDQSRTSEMREPDNFDSFESLTPFFSSLIAWQYPDSYRR